jgi:hypothetical protein
MLRSITAPDPSGLSQEPSIIDYPLPGEGGQSNQGTEYFLYKGVLEGFFSRIDAVANSPEAPLQFKEKMQKFMKEFMSYLTKEGKFDGLTTYLGERLRPKHAVMVKVSYRAQERSDVIIELLGLSQRVAVSAGEGELAVELMPPATFPAEKALRVLLVPRGGAASQKRVEQQRTFGDWEVDKADEVLGPQFAGGDVNPTIKIGTTIAFDVDYYASEKRMISAYIINNRGKIICEAKKVVEATTREGRVSLALTIPAGTISSKKLMEIPSAEIKDIWPYRLETKMFTTFGELLSQAGGGWVRLVE